MLKNRGPTLESLASLSGGQNPAEFQYERPEWTLFRSVNTLPQKAGVPINRLRRLVLKELCDNALDAGCSVRLGTLDEGGDTYFVEDDGPGIDPATVPRLFSINRTFIGLGARVESPAGPGTLPAPSN